MVVVQHGAMIEYVKPQGPILPALQFLSLIYSPEASKLQHNALLRRSGCHTGYREARLLKLKAMTRGLGDPNGGKKFVRTPPIAAKFTWSVTTEIQIAQPIQMI